MEHGHTDLCLSKLEFNVLKSLSRKVYGAENLASAVAIQRHVEFATSQRRIALGKIYVALESLEYLGYAISSITERRPIRIRSDRWYTITQVGIERLQQGEQDAYCLHQ